MEFIYIMIGLAFGFYIGLLVFKKPKAAVFKNIYEKATVSGKRLAEAKNAYANEYYLMLQFRAWNSEQGAYLTTSKEVQVTKGIYTDTGIGFYFNHLTQKT